MVTAWSSDDSQKTSHTSSSLRTCIRYSVAKLRLDSLGPHGLQHTRPPRLHHLPKFAQTHVRGVGDAIQPSHPLSSPSLPAPNPSQHQRWPKYWSFSFSIIPSKENPGLIFRMDWLDLLAVQGTLKNLLQHHSSKASILWRSAFFTVQLSHPYMTTGETVALTRWTFVDKVTSLLLNMLSRLVITFLPRSKRLLISWLQSPSAVILEPQKIKSHTVSTVSPCISHEVMGPDAGCVYIHRNYIYQKLLISFTSSKDNLIDFYFQMPHSN